MARRSLKRETRSEVTRAIQTVNDEFPLPNYIERVADSMRTVATAVEKILPTGASILDFGSGPCDKVAVLQNLGYQCSAFDDLQDPWHQAGQNRRKILDFARDQGIDLRLKRDDSAFLPWRPGTFDLVMLNDVLEHLHDSPRQLLLDLLRLVRPEGYVLVTVPSAVNIRKRLALMRGKTNLPAFNMFYWSPTPWRGHVREYVRDDLRQLARYLDLEVAELRTCHHMLIRLPKWARIPYRAVTAFFPGWRDSWLFVARKRANWRPLRSLSPEDYAQTVGLLVGYPWSVPEPAQEDEAASHSGGTQ
jgi:SAM-dependent methyltransferase